MFFTIILCFNKLYKFYVKYDKFYNKLYNKLYKLYTARNWLYKSHTFVRFNSR